MVTGRVPGRTTGGGAAEPAMGVPIRRARGRARRAIG